MYVITIIGASGMGKSPFIQNYVSGRNCLVWDIQDEYGKKTKYLGQRVVGLTEDNNKPRSRYIKGDMNEFITLCMNKRNTVCVFEEATMFFQGAIGRDMRRLLFSKAHTGNVFLLVFHSINSVPPRFMESTNYVVLFRTADQDKTVEHKYPSIYKDFLRIKSDSKTKYLIKKII